LIPIPILSEKFSKAASSVWPRITPCEDENNEEKDLKVQKPCTGAFSIWPKVTPQEEEEFPESDTEYAENCSPRLVTTQHYNIVDEEDEYERPVSDYPSYDYDTYMNHVTNPHSTRPFSIPMMAKEIGKSKETNSNRTQQHVKNISTIYIMRNLKQNASFFNRKRIPY